MFCDDGFTGLWRSHGNRPEVFLRAIGLLKRLKAKHSPVLVHCHAGQSRSAAVVCKFGSSDEFESGVMEAIETELEVAFIAQAVGLT
jgi:uncharacterized protein (DUF779 family)